MEISLFSPHTEGIHGRSVHHSQSQEEGEGKERERGREDGSGKLILTVCYLHICFTVYISIYLNKSPLY